VKFYKTYLPKPEERECTYEGNIDSEEHFSAKISRGGSPFNSKRKSTHVTGERVKPIYDPNEFKSLTKRKRIGDWGGIQSDINSKIQKVNVNKFEFALDERDSFTPLMPNEKQH
jgi:hypothetical protein